MFSPEQIRSSLSAVLRQRLPFIASSSPTAGAFARHSSAIPEQILVRHAVEHVFRIRLFRPIDVLATQLLLDLDPAIGKLWAGYARSEAVHDRYFLRDLSAMGVDKNTVREIPAFESTLQLVKFLEMASHNEGALPIVLYSFWTELNSEIGSLPIIRCNERVFGVAAARGASAHRNLDHNLDHLGMICRILCAVIRNDEDLLKAARLLAVITGFIGEYFAELDSWSRNHDVIRRLPLPNGLQPNLHQ